VYGNLAYDEDPHLHCLELTQRSWVLDPNYIEAQVVMVGKATRLPPWSHLVNQTPLHLGNDPFVLGKAYLLDVMKRMARIGIDKPP
jgi:hypothetical protein